MLAYGTAPTYTDATASGEQAVSGTVSGTYVDTTAGDGTLESITEVEDGGRPSQRTSLLEHVWTVPVPSGGSTVTLFVKGAASSSGDGDDFVFAYSLDGGSTYTDAVTFPAGASGTYSASLPTTTSGDVRVRVRDVNRAKGANALDRISVDHLWIRTDSTTTASAPSAPSSVSATATSATTIDVAWADVDGEDGYELERSSDSGATWTHVAKVGVGVLGYADSGLIGSTAYTYRVRGYNAAGASAWTLSNVETTPAASGITLRSAGWKDKGEHRIDLSWDGATSVRVFRDGQAVADVVGSSYTDALTTKGGGSYTHQVCAVADGVVGACSNEVVTSF